MYKRQDVDYEPGLCSWVRKSDGELVDPDPDADTQWYRDHDWNWDRDFLDEILSEVSSLPLFMGGMTSNQMGDLDKFDQVFYIQVPADELRRRMIERNPKSRTDKIDTVFEWHESFEKQMIESGAILINGNQEPEEVLEEIMSKISVH